MNKLNIKISLFLIYFVFAALLNSVGILVERSQEVYGVLKAEAAILEPFKDISIAVCSFLVGIFLPKIGYKKGLLISLIIVFVGCLGMYFSNIFWAVKILFACVGMSFAIVKVAVFTLIGFVTDSEEGHSQLMSLVETVFMLGIIFMYVIFPLFFDENDENAWLRGYLLMAGIIAVSFFIILFSKFQIESQPNEQLLSINSKVLVKLLANSRVWLFAIFAFFYVMTEQGIMTWLPTFNKEVLHITPKLATQMAVILMISYAVGRFLTGILVKRIKWYYIASSGVVISALLVLLVLPMAQNINATSFDSIFSLPIVSFLFPHNRLVFSSALPTSEFNGIVECRCQLS
ncbi:MFS transporter [Seonamhaeicola sp.]|uniref:MFS transporter n=1 Tax=Seonamhaeicola sp. TaxID=1912245 RepID=UPI00262D5EEA|nr:MFS transporter [Seonamhaeicola sp.]